MTWALNRRCSVDNWRTARLNMVLLVACALACSTPDRAVPSGAASVATLLRDARVDTAAHLACLAGDSLLRRMPGASLQWVPAIRFDSVWYGDSTRWGCQVVAAGHSKDSWMSVDTVMHTFTARGWSDQTMISADGPDGTVQAVHRRGVTCVVEGRWDGGDDSDTTYVPSDTIEVRVACARTVVADTLGRSPVDVPISPGVDPASGSRVMGTILKRP